LYGTNCHYRYSYNYGYSFPQTFPLVVYRRSPLTTIRDVAIMSGVSSLFIMHGVSKIQKRRQLSGSATVGTAVESLTVALLVPNRHDSRSILQLLDDLALTADTGSATGRGALLSTVALELLRRPDALQAVARQSAVFANPQQAQREFARRSIQERSKIEVETGT
jgi:uncharacterized membrane protein